MTASRPLVAVPAHRVDAGDEGSHPYGVPEPYLSAVSRAGGEPVLVVPGPGEREDELGGGAGAPVGGARAGALLARVDALLLPGGRDLDAARYGQHPHARNDAPDRDRDELELRLALAALRAAVPVLAICRGLQLLNVALGGTLRQHLPEVTSLDHGGEGDALHPVRADPRSRLASVCGERIERCASHHHQGVDVLAPDLVAVAWSDDGLVEAAELAGEPPAPWLLGVQWHPEKTAGRDPVQQGIFDALVEAASGARAPVN